MGAAHRRPAPLRITAGLLTIGQLSAGLMIASLLVVERSTAASPGSGAACAPVLASRPVPAPAGGTARPERPAAIAPAEPLAAGASDYRHRLQPSSLGWVHRRHWCVWIDPPSSPTGSDGISPGSAAAAPWDERWRRAVEAALASWQAVLEITLVKDPAQAQVQIHRRRPPLRTVGGAWRASHGRAELDLREVQRAGASPAAPWRREPLVQVLISPGQHERAIQATALHELGHAFGLWGHSDHSGDAMASAPGATPVLELSPRDRATLGWLLSQPSAVDP